jgi:hypothetical protein
MARFYGLSGLGRLARSGLGLGPAEFWRAARARVSRCDGMALIAMVQLAVHLTAEMPDDTWNDDCRIDRRSTACGSH